jgi:hypothetical protein
MVSTFLFFFLCGLFYDALSRMTGEYAGEDMEGVGNSRYPIIRL